LIPNIKVKNPNQQLAPDEILYPYSIELMPTQLTAIFNKLMMSRFVLTDLTFLFLMVKSFSDF